MSKADEASIDSVDDLDEDEVLNVRKLYMQFAL